MVVELVEVEVVEEVDVEVNVESDVLEVEDVVEEEVVEDVVEEVVEVVEDVELDEMSGANSYTVALVLGVAPPLLYFILVRAVEAPLYSRKAPTAMLVGTGLSVATVASLPQAVDVKDCTLFLRVAKLRENQ